MATELDKEYYWEQSLFQDSPGFCIWLPSQGFLKMQLEQGCDVIMSSEGVTTHETEFLLWYITFTNAPTWINALLQTPVFTRDFVIQWAAYVAEWPTLEGSFPENVRLPWAPQVLMIFLPVSPASLSRANNWIHSWKTTVYFIPYWVIWYSCLLYLPQIWLIFQCSPSHATV